MGKTNLGGVMGALIQLYHEELIDFFITEFGKNITTTKITNDIK
jgi:hypothetical protein